MSNESKTRTVVLPPDHCRWWLIQPGALVYYDHVLIDEKDHLRLKKAGDSSYHDNIVANFEMIQKETGAIISEQFDAPFRLDHESKRKRTVKLAGDILKSAVERGPGPITFRELRDAMIYAYQVWIDYNVKKSTLLYPGEKYRQRIMDHQIPESKDNLKKLKSVMASEFPELLDSSRDLRNVFVNIIGFSQNMISLSESGFHVYEPLMREYIPMIEILLKYRLVELIEKADEPLPFPMLMELYRSKLEKIKNPGGQCGGFEFRDFIRQRAEYSLIRRNLNRLDLLLQAARHTKSKKDTDIIGRELADLMRELEGMKKSVEWSWWGISVLTALMGIAGNVAGVIISLPMVSEQARSFAEEMLLSMKGIRPAGNCFIEITDRMGVLLSRRVRSRRVADPVFRFWV